MTDMYSYTVSKSADNKAFKKACNAIEGGLSGIKKDNLLVDVDGSAIQIYYANGKKIKVVNDYEVDAVYADSEIDLKDII